MRAAGSTKSDPRPITGLRKSASAFAGADSCRHFNQESTTMSKAYWIVRVSVRDEENYPKYLAAARVAFEKFGANFIVRGGAFESMEGTPRDRNVVVEFKDRATAMACYESPEY